MNIKFNITNLDIQVPEVESKITIENLTYEVTDLDFVEYTKMLVALPGIVREMRSAISGEEQPSLLKDLVMGHVAQYYGREKVEEVMKVLIEGNHAGLVTVASVHSMEVKDVEMLNTIKDGR